MPLALSELKSSCNYAAPCGNFPTYLVDLETLPYGGRAMQPTNGMWVDGNGGLGLTDDSYTSLKQREGGYRNHPDFTRTRFREEDLEFNPQWWFNNTSYLPWEYQQPDYQMDFDERMIDTRQVHKDVSEVDSRSAFLFKRFA